MRQRDMGNAAERSQTRQVLRKRGLGHPGDNRRIMSRNFKEPIPRSMKTLNEALGQALESESEMGTIWISSRLREMRKWTLWSGRPLQNGKKWNSIEEPVT
jgi:hypothetical protein